MKVILEGWPKHFSDTPDSIKPLYSLGSHFSTDDGIITFDDKIYIPTVMRSEILQRIHDGHQGVTKCRERAKSCVWWNDLSKDIANFVEKCSHCQLYKRTQKKEPLITTPLPDRPWQRIATDLCEFQNNHYLIISDYFSRYIEITNLKKNTTSMRVVEAIKTVCARWGIPETVISDNGPQFTSRQLKLFAVQTAKTMLRQTDPTLALMIYRSTPIEVTGYSPAQLIMGRQPKTTLPIHVKKLQPEWPNINKLKEKDRETKKRYEHFYNKRYGAKSLPELKPGDVVRVKTCHDKIWSSPVNVASETDQPRSNIVQTASGQLRKNRQNLQQNTGHTDCHLEQYQNRIPETNNNTTTDVASPQPKKSYTTRTGRRVKSVNKLDL
ncbi:uncharacterized protein [Antedon mediterranea]|uniref:uncharacterized protein n=1 Tax=Antedon mediterranea TaxID=105859 RepID=UPI003AF85E1A